MREREKEVEWFFNFCKFMKDQKRRADANPRRADATCRQGGEGKEPAFEVLDAQQRTTSFSDARLTPSSDWKQGVDKGRRLEKIKKDERTGRK